MQLSNDIKTIIQESIDLKSIIAHDTHMIEAIDMAIDRIASALKNGHKLLFCGNGGSAADAQHLAAEFSGRFYKDRKAWPAEALHTNSSYLTAVANDYSFDVVYQRLIDGIGQNGDILVALSTSGQSNNIIKACQSAQSKGLYTIGFTGLKGGQMDECTDLLFKIPSQNTPRIQECHMLIGHIICQKVEERLTP